MDILKTVLGTIKGHNMFSPGDRVLVGLSGGADSTALFHILLELKDELGIEIACAHVNHSLRKTADRDMDFCRKLCEKAGASFFSITKDIKTEAKSAGMSEELYARGVRYEFFDSLGFDKIATAHNKNDVAETLVFNFMRGAGIGGLSGIPYVRENVVRPLLDVKKSDITAFCKENGYHFVTDETNFEAIYSRNKIRLNLIPEIEREYNPAFVDVVTKNAKLLKEDGEFLSKLAKEHFSGEVVISELDKMEMPIKRRVLQLLWQDSAGTCENLGAEYIQDILMLLKKQTGKAINLPDGFVAKISYGKLVIEKNTEKKEYFYKIYPGDVLNISETGKTVTIEKEEKKPQFYLDEECELTVRPKKDGDIFYPTKMTGKKKLSDFFTDKKLTERQREETPLVLLGEEIVAVGDMRFSRNFQDSTKTGYKIKIEEMHNAE